VRLAPQIAILGIVLYWFVNGGGFDDTTWYPGALVIACVGIAVIYGTFRGAPRLGPRNASIVLLVAFAGWNFASIAWATDKGAAWDGANRAALYAIIYAVFAAARPSGRQLELLLVGFAGAVAIAEALVLHSASGSSSVFTYARLAAPAEYPNATAAALLIPMWTVVPLIANRGTRLALRAAACAVAGVLLDLAALTESRGALAATAVACVFVIVWSRHRLAAIWTLAALAASGAVFVTQADVIARDWPVRPSNAAVSQAEVFLLVTAVALAAAVIAVDRLARAWRATSPQTAAVARRGAAALTVAALLVGLGVVGASIGSPVAAARSAWSSFKSAPEPSGRLRVTTLGSNRYDFWRVSVIVFRQHPVVGVGSENFAGDYMRLRRSSEEPAFPHSLVFQLLEQLGAIGTLLFLGFVIAALASALRRRLDPGLAAAAAGGTAGFVYFVVHGSGDWLWEFPAVGGMAFAAAGIAVGASGSGREAARSSGKALVAATALLGACILSFVPPWFASRDAAAASREWLEAPAAAYSLYDRAARENPLDDTALVDAGVVAGHLGDAARMERYFERAASRNPGDWFTQLELAVARSNLGRWRAAQTAAAQARRQNPRDALVAEVAALVDKRRHVSPRFVEAAIYRRTSFVIH
jgi:tetratricopeptide (TPR) repeat protein